MRLFTMMLGLVLIGCSSSDDHFTLYRNSLVGEAMRIHVATFDTSDGAGYNMSNCQLAADLFQKQDAVKTKFWCEKGRYKK